MVVIPVPAVLAPAAAAVGMHGLSDAVTHHAAVPAYLLAIPAWPHTTAVFTLASIAHFAEDVGVKNSLLLHACIVGAATVSVPLSVAIALLYLCTVHVPSHFRRVERLTGRGLVSTMIVASLVGACCLAASPAVPLLVTEPAQRVVCVHIAIHLVQPLSCTSSQTHCVSSVLCGTPVPSGEKQERMAKPSGRTTHL